MAFQLDLMQTWLEVSGHPSRGQVQVRHVVARWPSNTAVHPSSGAITVVVRTIAEVM
jgi:hypothetical protein